MRVLHVIGPMEYGGAQTQLLGLVRAAHGTEWDAAVCSLAPGPLLPAFRELDVPLLELRRWGSPGLLRLQSLRQFVRAGRFNVVHSMLWHANVHARLAVAGLDPRPAVVIGERNVYPRRSSTRVALDLLLSRWTDLYVANSDAVAAFTRRVHPVGEDSLVTIPNAVDRSIFYALPDRPPSGPIRIGSIGRLEPEKGFETLIDASILLQERFVDFEVVVAGTGSQRTRLEALAMPTPTRFVGTLPWGHETAAFLRGLDVFVLASHHSEGRPNALLEALACGVPVVAADSPGVGEAVGDASRLVPPRSPEALAGAVADVLTDTEARARSRAAAESIPTFEDLAVQYREAFERAVALRAAAA